jgi:hypothetical protein
MSGPESTRQPLAPGTSVGPHVRLAWAAVGMAVYLAVMVGFRLV